MRESFILHSEYIEDLPEEYKSIFLMYSYNYGIKGEIPSLTGLEQSIWLKIQRRIDHDLETWEETKNSRARGGKNHKGNQYTKKKEVEQVGTNGTDFQKMELNGTERNTTEQVGTNGTVYVSVNDSVSVYDDGDGDGSVNAGVPPEEPPPPPPFLSESQENYSRIVFEKFKDAGLPCQNGDFFKFQSCDFRLALQKLKGFPSQDVIQAVDNYILELKNPESYVDKEFSFPAFVGSKTFTNCLPANYRARNFVRFARDGDAKPPDSQQRRFFETCPECGQRLLEWKNDTERYECGNCKRKFTWEAINCQTK